MASSSFKDDLMGALTEYIAKQLNQVFDDERDKLVASFESERDRIVAAAALKISNYMSVQENGREIRITVQKTAPNKPSRSKNG